MDIYFLESSSILNLATKVVLNAKSTETEKKKKNPDATGFITLLNLID